MYAPQGLPAVFSSVLASSVIIVAARSGLLPPCVVPALGFCLHVPELFGIVDQAKQKLIEKRFPFAVLPSLPKKYCVPHKSKTPVMRC